MMMMMMMVMMTVVMMTMVGCDDRDEVGDVVDGVWGSGEMGWW